VIEEIALGRDLKIVPGHLYPHILRAQIARHFQRAGDFGRLGFVLDVVGVDAQLRHIGPGDRRGCWRVGDTAIVGVIDDRE
jgi:hypothetical protein